MLAFCYDLDLDVVSKTEKEEKNVSLVYVKTKKQKGIWTKTLVFQDQHKHFQFYLPFFFIEILQNIFHVSL